MLKPAEGGVGALSKERSCCLLLVKFLSSELQAPSAAVVCLVSLQILEPAATFDFPGHDFFLSPPAGFPHPHSPGGGAWFACRVVLVSQTLLSKAALPSAARRKGHGTPRGRPSPPLQQPEALGLPTPPDRAGGRLFFFCLPFLRSSRYYNRNKPRLPSLCLGILQSVRILWPPLFQPLPPLQRAFHSDPEASQAGSLSRRRCIWEG